MTIERTDHAAAAVDYLSDTASLVSVDRGEDASITAHMAQAHATLALVEQQRIANLIALSSHRSAASPMANHATAARDHLTQYPAGPVTLDDLPDPLTLNPDIAAALGIDQWGQP